ncbi:hypothetical protein ABTW72_17620 [Micromonospora sp. NPDC127501]|uniref:hypothetical protein n=1 Tax=Micromonospora sp. NPDC127501 TaxID=3154872 RepID=UPI00332AA2E6
MKFADWVAVYGALVATAVAVWQGVTYWQDRRPKLLLTSKTIFDLMGEGRSDKYVEALETASPELFAEIMGFEFTIVNVGRVKVHLRDLALDQSAPPRSFSLKPSAAFPRWIEPGEAIVIVPTAEDMAGVDLTADVRVRLTTSTGQELYENIRGFDAASARALSAQVLDGTYLDNLQASITAMRLHLREDPSPSPEDAPGEERILPTSARGSDGP